MSEDPIRDGLNFYTYCNGNPVAFIDSNGLEPYSVKLQSNVYSLFVSSQNLDFSFSILGIGYGAINPFIGVAYAIGQPALLRSCGFRSINNDISDLFSIGNGLWGGLAQNKYAKRISQVLGFAGDALEVGTYFVDWLGDKQYQLEEAIYNQFDRKIWESDTRDWVDQKFNYAMYTMLWFLTEGTIFIAKASDVFDNESFHNAQGEDITTQYDPLTGRDVRYYKDQYYFFMSSQDAEYEIHELEKNIRTRILEY